MSDATMYYVTNLPEDTCSAGLHLGALLTTSLDSARTWANWVARDEGGVLGILAIDMTDIPVVYEGVQDERYGPQFRNRRVADPLRITFKETLEKDAHGLPVVTQVET